MIMMKNMTRNSKPIYPLAKMLLVLTGIFVFISCKQQPGWIDLVPGDDLSAWTLKGGTAIFTVSDGVLTGRTPMEESPTSYFCTVEEYGDFELEFETKIDEGFNSGVQIRSREMDEAEVEAVNEAIAQARAVLPAVQGGMPGGQAPGGLEGQPGMPVGQGSGGPEAPGEPQPGDSIPPRGGGGMGPVIEVGTVWGPQIEIASGGERGTSNSGYIFGEHMLPGMWLSDEESMETTDAFISGEWNKYRVVAQGPSIQIWINDQLIEDFYDEEVYESHPKGFIGLQCHFVQAGTGPFEVSFRNIRIKSLD
jgi:hypothetical protein